VASSRGWTARKSLEGDLVADGLMCDLGENAESPSVAYDFGCPESASFSVGSILVRPLGIWGRDIRRHRVSMVRQRLPRARRLTRRAGDKRRCEIDESQVIERHFEKQRFSE
jgi:hypothetical protein